MSMIKTRRTKCTDPEALRLFAERTDCSFTAADQIVTLSSRKSGRGNHGWVQIDLATGQLSRDQDYSWAAGIEAKLVGDNGQASDLYNLCLVKSRYPGATEKQDAEGHFYLEIEVETTHELGEQELVTE